MSFLDDLPNLIADALGGDFLDALLTRDVPGTPDPAAPWAPAAQAPLTYPCRAIEEEWSASFRQGELVNAGDRRVLVLASTLEVQPVPGDRVSIRRRTFTVVSHGSGPPAVSTDPAKAVWVLRARA